MNLRILSIALLAAASFTTWTATVASATTLESPEGTIYTGSIAAQAEGHVVLDNPIATIECASNISGESEIHGEGVTVSGSISALTFTSCTNNWHVTTVSAGALEVHGTGS